MKTNNEAKNHNGWVNIVGEEFYKKLSVYSNIGQDIIVITADKMRLVLLDTKEALSSRKDWIAPLGLFIAIALALCTTEFRESTLGIDKNVWETLFVIGGLASFVWLIITIIRAIINWRKGNIEKIIDRLKLEEKDLYEYSKKTQKISNRLRIIRATYGTGKSYVDITQQLNQSIKNDKLAIVASNEIAGDPDHGVVKKLAVKYEIDGKVVDKEFKENDRVNLP